jgi:hypothetical protein
MRSEVRTEESYFGRTLKHGGTGVPPPARPDIQDVFHITSAPYSAVGELTIIITRFLTYHTRAHNHAGKLCFHNNQCVSVCRAI